MGVVMSANNAKSRRRDVLDGLRGLAAIAVIFLHGSEIFLLPWVPRNAYLAVDFFFLLSGYVLAKNFDRRLRAGWISSFMSLRLIRLYPLVVAGSFIGFVVLLCRSVLARALSLQEVTANSICSLLLLPTPPLFRSTWSIYPNDPPLWSLFYELLVNLLYAVIGRWLTDRRLAVLVVAAALALGSTVVILGTADFALDHFELAGLRVLFSFFLGVGMYRVQQAASLQPLWGVVSRGSGLVVPLSFLILAVVFFSPVPLSADYALVSIFVVFPVLLALAQASEGGRWSGIFLWLGLISYPIYALHQPFFRLASGVLFHSSPLPTRLMGFAGATLAAVLLAWISAVAYDAPVRAWLTALTSGRGLPAGGGARRIGAAARPSPRR